MKLAGRIITWVGGLLFVAACFLHFSGGATLWSGGARYALLVTLLAVAGVTLSVVSIFADFPVLVGAQVALGVYAFGEVFTLSTVFNTNFSGLQIGFWLASISAAAMLVGACLLAASIWGRQGWRPTTGLVGTRGPLTAAAAQNVAYTVPTNGHASPAPGWYRDPSGQAGFRYWSGQAWTDQVQA